MQSDPPLWQWLENNTGHYVHGLSRSSKHPATGNWRNFKSGIHSRVWAVRLTLRSSVFPSLAATYTSERSHGDCLINKEFYVFRRFPFGYVSSMQHFNIAMDQTVTYIKEQLAPKGLPPQTGNWVVRYVDDVLIGSTQPSDHYHCAGE